MRETTPIRDFNSCESVKVAFSWGGDNYGTPGNYFKDLYSLETRILIFCMFLLVFHGWARQNNLINTGGVFPIVFP